MPEEKQRTESIYERWKSENNKKFYNKHSKEDGETLEKFYNRIKEQVEQLLVNILGPR
jgi:hypothetical protein